MNSNICHCELFEGDFQAVFFMFQDEFLRIILNEYIGELKITSDSLENQPLFQLFNDAITGSHHLDKVYLDCLPCVSVEEVLNQIIPLFNYVILEAIEKKPGFSLYIKGAFTRIFHLLSMPSLYSIEKIHSEANQHEYLTTKIMHIFPKRGGTSAFGYRYEHIGYYSRNRLLKPELFLSAI